MGDHENARKKLKRLQDELEMHRLIFDSIYNGAMVTDAEGFVTHFNKPYGVFLGLEPAAQIGRHCSEAVENSRMHIVAQTGRAEINESHMVKGQSMVVQRIPIHRDGKVVAVFGQVMFKDVRDVRKLADRLCVLESKIKLYEEELRSLRSTRYTFDSIAGVSRSAADLKNEAQHAAANALPVLITGESGTGKELFAQAIHHAGPRNIHPFVRINCAAIPRDLLESELFGYEKGAFTGARTTGKIGKFELAHRGTVFLDEIGDLPMEMQPKLLRVLEEKEFERIGGTRPIRSDFRVIAATNQKLEQLMEEGRFRKDLFYRLSVIPLRIPPLRERRSDIVPIARHLLTRLQDEANIGPIEIGSSAEKVLTIFEWPGNVRELCNVLERTVSTLQGSVIRDSDLPFFLRRTSRGDPRETDCSIRAAQAKAEIRTIQDALERCGHNKSQAARLLGIHRTLLYRKIKKYGITAGK